MLNYNDLSITEATAIQEELRYSVSLVTEVKMITTIAGADVSSNEATGDLYAGIVVLSYPKMELLSYSLIKSSTRFPYVPHYLAFREVPPLLQAWEQLPVKPDVVVLDGQGIIHPRRIGIASHFGVLADQATIGCAKRLLYGSYKPLGLERLSTSYISDGTDILGHALRTKQLVKPVYISPGHRISIPDSIHIMKNCVLKHRIPEPTRIAHDKVNLFRISMLREGYHAVENMNTQTKLDL